MIAFVATTIQPPTDAMRKWKSVLDGMCEHRFIVIGDKRGPGNYFDGADFWHAARQATLEFHLAKLLPWNHYARKNLGYLLAIRDRVQSIFETDDDNEPMSNWKPRQPMVNAVREEGHGWRNVHAWFGADTWPRGLPFRCIHSHPSTTNRQPSPIWSPIQHGMVDHDPDVDAVCRLMMRFPVPFMQEPALALEKCWCPFSTQNTWWFPEAWPFLYLPSHCTFRMTDIWRSFIAQRCLWQMQGCVTFHAPDVIQYRNPHNIETDLRDEIPGYVHNDRIRELLESVEMALTPDQNLLRCYEALVRGGIFPEAELELVQAWIADTQSNAPHEPRGESRQ